jgi:hypothetical protein
MAAISTYRSARTLINGSLVLTMLKTTPVSKLLYGVDRIVSNMYD